MRSSTYSRWALAVACATLALGAAACGSDDDDAESAAGGTTKITLGMNNPNYAAQMHVYVALEKGWFKEEGVDDVEIITTDEFVAGLVGGSLDITQGDTDQLLAAAHKNPDMKLIGNFRDGEWQMLGVGEGIGDAADLKGKTVTAGERGGRNEYVLKTMLGDLGLSPEDVEFAPLGGGSDARLQAVINGQVAASNLFPRHEVALTEAGGKFIHRELKNVPQESIATTTEYLEKNRGVVLGYWKASLRAREYIEDPANKDEIIEIMRKNKFEVPPEFVEVFDAEVEQNGPDGGFDPAGMDDLISSEQELELLPAGLEWRKLFDLDVLWEAQEALGIEQNPTPDALTG